MISKDYYQMTFVSNPKPKRKKVRDDFKAFLVMGARFTDTEQYPIIESWMVPDEINDAQMIPFNKIDKVKNIEDYYICFFCRDIDMIKVHRNPKKYLQLFRRAKGIIGFDYSIYNDMPIIKQKAQMNDNLAMTFFFGMRYIPVIPNIRYGNEVTRDEFLKAIPKNSYIAIGSYGCVRSKEEKDTYRSFLEEMLPTLRPKGVLVYGAMPKDVFGNYISEYRFIRCPAFIEKEMKGGKKNVCNKRSQ